MPWTQAVYAGCGAALTFGALGLERAILIPQPAASYLHDAHFPVVDSEVGESSIAIIVERCMIDYLQMHQRPGAPRVKIGDFGAVVGAELYG